MTDAEAKIQVTEIFASLQGESSHAGQPCVFIRLTGCPYRCVWCDTSYAFDGGREMTVEDAVKAAKAFGLHLVEVTGGEPLAQAGAVPLLRELQKAGLQVLLETGGAFSVEPVPEGVVRVMDVKCPGSGVEAHNDWDNLGQLRPTDEVKFVLRDVIDYNYARDVIARFGLEGRFTLLFSPVQGQLEPAELAAWMLRDRVKARLNLQLQKIVWGNDTRK